MRLIRGKTCRRRRAWKGRYNPVSPDRNGRSRKEFQDGNSVQPSSLGGERGEARDSNLVGRVEERVSPKKVGQAKKVQQALNEAIIPNYARGCYRGAKGDGLLTYCVVTAGNPWFRERNAHPMGATTGNLSNSYLQQNYPMRQRRTP